MRIRQHPAATAELDEALDWYAQRNPRAAEALWREVQHARALVIALPRAAPAISPHARRLVLHGYPYDIIYCLAGEEILVVAYAHHKRRPGYWRERLGNSH